MDLHGLCIQLSPHSAHQVYYQSLVCGKKLYNAPEGLQLRHLGLIHIFVVSGAHLQFLDRILSPLQSIRLWRWLRLPALLTFVLAAAFPITAFRAWLFLVIKKFNQTFHLHFSNSDQLLLSVLLPLFLFPQQYLSVALPLSWVASLGLQIGKNSLSQSTWVYLLTLPIVCSFQWLSPWTILINGLVAPSIGSILFPVSFFTFVFPPLVHFSDSLWTLFENSMGLASQHLQSFAKPLPLLPHFQYWFYCVILHFGFGRKINSK